MSMVRVLPEHDQVPALFSSGIRPQPESLPYSRKEMYLPVDSKNDYIFMLLGIGVTLHKRTARHQGTVVASSAGAGVERGGQSDQCCASYIAQAELRLCQFHCLCVVKMHHGEG